MIQVIFIINSTRKLSKDASQAIELCRNNNKLSCTISKTKEEKDAIKLAKLAVESKVNVIVAVGGDGTCNEVLNGMMMSDNSNSKFAIIPNGTGNDFHRMLGLFTPEKFVENLLEQKSKSIDIIKVELNNQSKYTLNIAGCGFDGFVVNLLNKQRERFKIGGKFSYALAILRSFILFKKSTLKIATDTFYYEGKGLLVAACNGSTFGHGLVIYPKAKLDSGYFGVTLIGDVTLFDYVRYLKRIKMGIEIDHPQVRYLETTKMSIKTNDPNLFVECDGELFSNGSSVFEVVPNAVALIF